jgi:hypothetical protein
MPAGLSGSGHVGLALEAVKGTYVAPTVYVPILSESFRYVEDRYYSPQIRQATEVSDVKQGYYHVEGDIEMEVDANFLPYFLFCTRHTPASAAGIYTFIPSTAGSTSTAASGMVQRTASITITRNGITRGYAGCTCGSLRFFVDGGVLKFAANMIGESDAAVSTPSPTWAAPALFGADSHYIRTDASGTAPGFAAAAVVDFNGFEWMAEFGAEAQNRIVATRSASYVSFGETVLNMNTELDFVDVTEYNNFVASTQKAIQFESLNGGATFAACTQGVQIVSRRGVYETYDLGLSGLGDLIMAGVTMRSIGIAGASSYTIKVKSPAVIT